MTSYSEHRFDTLDGVRGTAAMVVAVYHYYGDGKIVFLLNSYIAVDLFFILSGFVIVHAYEAKLIGGMTFSEFIIRRIARLWPLMAASLLAGAPVFWAWNTLNNFDYTLRDVVASTSTNMVFIPFFSLKKSYSGSLCPTDGALWSVFFEMFLSLAFAKFLKLRVKDLLVYSCVFLGVLLLYSVVYAFSNYEDALKPDFGWKIDGFVGGFPRCLFGFLAGMFTYRVWRDRERIGFMRRISLVRFLSPISIYVAVLVMLLWPWRAYGLYYFAAASLAAPTIVLLAACTPCRTRWLSKGSRFLGWMSYPVYCLHQPVFTGVSALDRYAGLPTAGVSRQSVALCVTLAAAAALAWSLDRLRVQQRLTRGLMACFRVEPGRPAASALSLHG